VAPITTLGTSEAAAFNFALLLLELRRSMESNREETRGEERRGENRGK